jgi:UDP-galactose transporter B1
MNSVRTLVKSLDDMPSESRLVAYTVSLYATFMVWGYLQERITAARYIPTGYTSAKDAIKWDFPFVLNMCMAAATYGVAHIVESFNRKQHHFPKKFFWRPALAATLASPLGYASLKYINYPFMVLTKSSKPVPIMIVGGVFFGQKYPWFKYVSVAMLCLGISTLTLAQSSSKGQSSESAGSFGLLYSLYGVVLILLNLAMDGYTNNEQDRLYKEMPLSATQMMKQTNYWQCIFQAVLLAVGVVVLGRNSQLIRASVMVYNQPPLLFDIAMFCTCATVGQLLIFRLIKEYGSLVWVTISVTRQLFTILLSVMLFGHRVNLIQWLGVVLVFSGLGTDILFTFLSKLRTERMWDGKIKTLPDAITASLSAMSSTKMKGKTSTAYGSGSRGTDIGYSTGGANSTNSYSNSYSRPGVASRSSSGDYVDIEQQVQRSDGEVRPFPSPGSGASRKAVGAGSARWGPASAAASGTTGLAGSGRGVPTDPSRTRNKAD